MTWIWNHFQNTWNALPWVPVAVFSVVFMAMFGLEILIAVRSRGRATAEKDEGSLKRIAWIRNTVLIGGLILALFPIVPLPGGRACHYYSGTVLVGLGLILRAWAVARLGDYFTYTVMSHADQALIIDGPYRYVRHPGYSGGLLVYAGWGMATGSLVGLVVIVAMMAYGLIRRIQVEEKVMIEAFGEQYSNYMKRTKRLIPWIY